jgi:hypothetical protein
MNYGQNTESNKKLESRVFYEGQMTPCRHFWFGSVGVAVGVTSLPTRHTRTQ